MVSQQILMQNMMGFADEIGEMLGYVLNANVVVDVTEIPKWTRPSVKTVVFILVSISSQ